MLGWRSMVAGLQTRAAKLFGEGTSYTFEPYDGAAVAIAERGIFRAPAVEVAPADESRVRSSSPTLDVRLAVLPNYPRPGSYDSNADAVTIHFQPGDGFQWSADTRFRIVDEMPDGEGMTTLVLQELKP